MGGPLHRTTFFVAFRHKKNARILLRAECGRFDKSVTVVRMEVPCCGGLELAAKKALQHSGKFIPWQVVTVTVDGRLVEE